MPEFFKIMAPVLAANLLTVAFVYAMFTISRHEKEGTEPPFFLYGLILLIGFFLLGGLYLGGDLDWVVKRFS